MFQIQLKLRLTKTQERRLNHWLWNLTGIWNWAIKKIELDAKDKYYHGAFNFRNLLSGHSQRMGIPSHVMQSMLKQAHTAWQRCFKKIGGRPKFKGTRNKLNSISFPDPIKAPDGNRIALLGIGSLRFHKQNIPVGKIKCGRIIRRASGWYLCLFIDSEIKPTGRINSGEVGIDPGFKHLLTLSTGEKIEHPRELEISAKRLAQAQRGKNRKLTARLHEKIANQRKDRNHKLSKKLVSENIFIAFSKDNHQKIAKKFGRSVSSSSHGQLRQMLRYKSRIGGTEYVEVNPKNSTSRWTSGSSSSSSVRRSIKKSYTS